MGTKVYDNYADLITFNRNSKGTALRPIGYGDELVVNGTFDTDSDWTLVGTSEISGGKAVLPSVFDYINQQLIGSLAGAVYKVSFSYTGIPPNNGGGIVRLSSVSGFTTVTGSGYNFSYTGSAEFYIKCESNDAYLGFYLPSFGTTSPSTTIDNVSVKEVLFDREGDPLTLFLHPEGVPRIEYDADRNLKGLLIEPEATNLLNYSSAMATHPWTLRGFSSLSTTETAPDGTTTAVKVEEDDTDGNPAVYYNLDTSGGLQQTFSVWLKADANISLYLSTTGGTLGSSVSVTTEWQRFEVTQSIDSYTGPHIGGFFTITQGSGVTFYMWGAQLETGPIATSYMPTTGSPFTRDADDATMTNVSGLIGQKEGTIYVEVDWRVESGVSQRIMQIVNSGAFSDRIDFYRNNPNDNIRVNIIVDGSEEQNAQAGYTGQTGVKKIAVAYKTKDTKIFLDGSVIAIASATPGNLSNLNLDDIFLGQSALGGGQVNMWIRAVQIIPRRLSDEQLIELTS